MKGRFVLGLSKIYRARFVYTAPTLGAAVKLLWEPLQETIQALGIADEVEFREAPREGGKICWFERTASMLHVLGTEDRKDMAKLRGQPFDGLGLDEVQEYRPDDLDWLIDRIIMPRLGERHGWLMLGGTPGHIMAGRFYESTRPGSTKHRPYARRDDLEHEGWRGWSSHAWSLADVMDLPDSARWPGIVANWEEALETKQREGMADDHPIWMREYLGKWATDHSELVYKYRAHVDGMAWNQWDPPRDGPLGIAKLPEQYDDWNYGFGVDLGSKDPLGVVVLAMSPSDPTRTLYHIWEVQRPRAYSKIIAQILLGEDADHEHPRGLVGALGWPNGIVVDCAQLGQGFLDELQNVYGLHCAPSARKPGEKFSAIVLTNGLLIDGRIKVLKGSELEQQLGQLRWKEDEFRIVREDKAQANHLTDALVYARQVLAPLLGGPTEEAAPKPLGPIPTRVADPNEPVPKRREPDGGIGRGKRQPFYDPYR